MSNNHTQHIGQLNGKATEIVLNAPYETLAEAGRFSQGNAARRFCIEQDFCQFIKVIGDQVWASQTKGILLSAWIDQQLMIWGLDKKTGQLYFPLDTEVYCVEINQFGCVPGTEEILSVEQTIDPSHLQRFVIDGGELSESFTQEIVPTDDRLSFAGFKFESINKELAKSKLFILPHFVMAASVVITAAAVLYAASFILTSESDITLPEFVSNSANTTGSDIAVNQLLFVDRVLGEVGYFVDKGLTSVKYDNGVITLSGDYPSTTALSRLIADTKDTDLNIELTQSGWQLVRQAEFERRELFSLLSYNENYLAVQRLEDRYGFAIGMDAPATDSNRKSATLDLRKNLSPEGDDEFSSGMPSLTTMASMLEGYAIALNSLEVSFDDYTHDFLTMSLTVTGTRL